MSLFLNRRDSSTRDPAELFQEQDIPSLLRDFCGSLPQDCSDILFLRYIKGMTQEQVGERMGISRASVQRREYFSLAALRRNPSLRDNYAAG